VTLVEQLVRDEGEVLRPYRDSRGFLTIGVGHNLDAKPISRRASRVILEDDIADAVADLHHALPWAALLDEARQGVLVNMTFNMGLGGLLTFKKFLAAMQAGQWPAAAREILESEYAKQVGERAKRLAIQTLTGVWA